MDLYSDNWFKYLREGLVTEGLRDIGLPEFVIDYIEEAMPDSPEKLWANYGKTREKTTLQLGHYSSIL